MALVLVGGAYGLFGAVIAGLLAKAFPALLATCGVNGNIATIIFGITVWRGIQPSFTSSANTFHMPMSPVPPPVG